MAEISDSTRKLIRQYSAWQNSLRQKDVSTIHVDEVAQRVAAFYEQIRTIIDWKEEHLMRRVAIIRNLKRRFSELESTENIAEPLVIELIRGGYFPNDRIEESKINDTQNIINKYVFIFKNSPKNKKSKNGLNISHNLLEIAACEIEETLAPYIKEMALIDYMFDLMRERIKVQENIYTKNLLKKESTDIQIYIAVQQSLFKLDEPIISYNLIKYKYPFWGSPSEEELLKISQNIYKILKSIDQDINHPLAKKFYTICEKYDTPYLILGDILNNSDLEKIEETLNDPATLEKSIKENYAKRLINLKEKINRAATYSTASIFITKILSLLFWQFILIKIFGGHLEILSLVADIAIPTLLMAGMVTTISPPSSKNLHIVVLETMKIVYKKEKLDTYEIKLGKKRGFLTRFFLSLIYLAGAVTTLGVIYGVFAYFQFPISSIIINFIFIALILFAGTAIRSRSQELTIEEESTGILGFISDILLLPITGLGGWMSKKWKQYNIVAALFSALIDMPFSAFIEFLERWRGFIKERKEELR